MKTILNKTTSIKFNEDRNFMYSDLIRACLDSLATDGITNEDMLKSFRIEKNLESIEDDKIKMEDADFEFFKNVCFARMRWRIRHKDIKEFIECIDNIK